MGRNTSISLGQHFEEFIKSEVDSGRYNSASEVVRDALRILEKRKEQDDRLLSALKAGEDSGYSGNFTAAEFLAEMKAKYE